MADLTPNHPADKVAARALRVSDEAEIAASDAYAQGVGERPFSQRMRVALNAALPHLTAADLRDTPAGRKLMAEGWRAALAQLDALAQTYNEKGDHLMAEDLRFVHGRIARHNPYRGDVS